MPLAKSLRAMVHKLFGIPTWIFLALGAVLLVFVVVHVMRFMRHISLGAAQSLDTTAFEQHPAAPTARILIAGDSVALGVGASAPEKTISGLFARDFPTATIVNVGVSGAETKDLAAQWQTVGDQHFDVAVIIVGANDVVHMAALEKSEQHLTAALAQARGLADHVVLMPEGNIGNAPLFPRVAAWLLTRRSREVQERFARVAAAQGAVFIDVFHEREDDPWRADSKNFYAVDFFHPGDGGYADWYNQIRQGMEAAGIVIS